MPPIPCAHCGNNFMRTTTDPEAPKLCNNCAVREERRAPKMEEKKDTIDILIKCPKKDYAEIEEICINTGVDVTKYFMNLHASNGPKVIYDNRTLKEKQSQPPAILERNWKTKEEVEEYLPKNKGKKK